MREFVRFVGIQVQSAQCALWLFACGFLSAYSPWPRYDALLIACLGIQVGLVLAKQETWRESLALSAFHLLGLGLEVYKVHHGSWQYTAAGNWRIADVPLFSGFMYAAVASYLLQAWRRFDLKFGYWPRPAAALLLALAIYANFFLNRWLGDFRWIIGVFALAIFWRTYVDFTVTRRWRMPLPLAFFLIGLFIYFAENLCTLMGLYSYPHQIGVWSPVGIGKLSSWVLLCIVSVLVLAAVRRDTLAFGVREGETAQRLIPKRGS